MNPVLIRVTMRLMRAARKRALLNRRLRKDHALDFPGYDIAKQLKYEPGLERTRIIAVSGRPTSDRQLAIDAGCDEFYRKPLEIELLEELIANGSEGAFGSERSA